MGVPWSTRAGNGVLWGTSIGTFLIFLVMERRLFMRYLNETGWLLAIAGIVLGAALLSIFGGRALPVRWLAVAILGNAVILALCWFLVFFDLPRVELGYADDATAWVRYVQIVMLVIHVASQPVLLIEWTRRCSIASNEGNALAGNDAILATVALIVAGSIAIIAGILAGVGNRWPVLVGSVASVVTSACVVAMHGRAVVDPAPRHVDNVPGRSDANLLFRDISITILASIPAFSMMARESFLFPTLVYTGTSIASFGIVHVLVARTRKGPGALAIIEGVLVAMYVVVMGMFLYLYQHDMTSSITSGVPEFITGFALGYFWTRVMHVGEGIEYPKGFPLIPRHGIGQDATAKFVAFLLVFLIGASVTITVNPVDPETIMYVYPAGLAIAVVDLLLWAVSASCYKP